MKKSLFLVLHRKDRSPGQRYRHEQYIPYLEENGVTCEVSLLLNESDDLIFYSSGNVLKKIIIGVKSLLKRFRDVKRAQEFDSIYIYRDAFFFGSFIEKKLAKKGVELIYDFDDAIWLKDENPNQGVFNRLKNPKKISTIISLVNKVIVGNEYLAAYALKYNANVHVIPSTIDFNKYSTDDYKTNRTSVCIGWTGSFSTLKHFETIVPALKQIKSSFGDKVYFKLIGDSSYKNEELGIEGTPWNSDTETQDLGELDIGIMPLPDNEWTQGKCAMKGLQYMALGIPTIMSPVGVNSDIIVDGVNGMLASSEDEWVKKLSLLIQAEELRKTMGEAGRKTVLKDFSVEVNKEKWLEIFTNS